MTERSILFNLSSSFSKWVAVSVVIGLNLERSLTILDSLSRYSLVLRRTTAFPLSGLVITIWSLSLRGCRRGINLLGERLCLTVFTYLENGDLGFKL